MAESHMAARRPVVSGGAVAMPQKYSAHVIAGWHPTLADFSGCCSRCFRSIAARGKQIMVSAAANKPNIGSSPPLLWAWRLGGNRWADVAIFRVSTSVCRFTVKGDEWLPVSQWCTGYDTQGRSSSPLHFLSAPSSRAGFGQVVGLHPTPLPSPPLRPLPLLVSVLVSQSHSSHTTYLCSPHSSSHTTPFPSSTCQVPIPMKLRSNVFYRLSLIWN